MYSAERHEIAKPSEFFNSVKAYMSVFQTLENYGKGPFNNIKSERLIKLSLSHRQVDS